MLPAASSAPRSSTSTPAPTRCCGSTCSGSSGTPRCTSSSCPASASSSEVLPVFCRKPLFGYPFVVFSGAAIGFVGWGVWAHHMFAIGLGPGLRRRVLGRDDADRHPDGREDRQLDHDDVGRQAPLHHGDAVRHRPDRASSRSAVCPASPTPSSPSDTQQTDTYYIVAHFHYVLFGGAVFGLFAGFYYWWPKVFGRMLNETLGKWNFWLMVIGMNLTFGPMHILGLQGQPRRMYRYARIARRRFFNLELLEHGRDDRLAIIALGVLLFIINVVVTTCDRRNAPLDPWDARTLEWMTTSPPKEHNFDVVPTVHSLDEFFHRKYEEDEDTGELKQDRHGRGDPGRAGGARRHAHPHAVAVVLADRARPRPAGHRLRRHLQPHPRRGRRAPSSCSASSAGRSSRRSPTRPTTTRRPMAGARRSWRPLADIALHRPERPAADPPGRTGRSRPR